MEAATKDDLELRRVVRLTTAARVLNIHPRTLRGLLAKADIPLVDLGPKSRGVFLKHLDELLLSRSKSPAQVRAAAS
jgi:hypothetical protein